MFRTLLAAGLLVPTIALAQSSSPPPSMPPSLPQAVDPNVQALSQTVLDLTGQNVQLRAQLIAAQAENKRLIAENDHLKEAAKPAAPAPEPPAGK